MSHTATHPHAPHRARKSGGAMFAGIAALVVLALAIFIGWAVWSGLTPMLHDRAMDVEITMPHGRMMPVPTDPQPMPMPSPTPTPPR